MVQSTLEFCRIGWTLAKDPVRKERRRFVCKKQLTRVCVIIRSMCWLQAEYL